VLAPPIADLVADGLEEEAHLLAAIGEAGAVARLPALRHLPQLPVRHLPHMVPHHFACRTGLVIPNNPRLAANFFYFLILFNLKF
jgi:hypothetical protein